MLELKFHQPDYPYFYEDDGVTLKEEPEDSLEEMLTAHQKMCDCFRDFQRRKYEAEAPYRKTRIVNGKEQTYIDYDAWEAADSDEFLQWGLADFNGFNGIDLLEFDIDLKIMHINAKGC